MDPSDNNNLFEMIEAQARLVDDGIEAWRATDYSRAVELLTLGLDADKDNWAARFYLALSYKCTGQLHTAANHFRYLQSQCGDESIKKASSEALEEMETELKKSSRLNPVIGARAPIQPDFGSQVNWRRKRSQE